jgi:uridine kinase
MTNAVMIIGIAGASASGKSLLANTLAKEIGSNKVVVIPQDSYYRDRSDIPLSEREKINYDHPDAFDHDLMIKHISELQKGHEIKLPQYNFAKHCRETATKAIKNYHIVIMEGILLFTEPTIRKMMDVRIFMDTPLDICLIRRLRRDIAQRGRTLESVIEQYENTVRPMYLQFIEPSKRYADIIVPRGGENRIAIDMIKAKFLELLKQRNV